MQALSLGLRAPYRLKRWVTLLAQASLRLDFTKGGPLDSRVTFTRASGGTSFRPVGYGPELLVDKSNLNGSTTRLVVVAPGALGRAFLITGASGLHWHDGTGITPITSNSVIVWPASGPGGFLNLYNNTAGVLPLSGVSVQQVILDRAGDPIQLFTSPANVPRIDYDPATGACKGLLVEEQRTNLILNSDSSTYSANAGSGSAVGVSNSGGVYTITKTGSGGYAECISRITVGGSIGQSWTIASSCQVRIISGSASDVYFGVMQDGSPYAAATNALSSLGVQSDGNWYTISSVRTQTTSGNTMLRAATFVFNVAALATLEVRYPQAEVGAFPTSYIPTNGAAATRAADLPSVNTLTPWFNSVEGTWFAEFRGGLESSQGGYGRAISAGGSDSIISREGGNRVGTWDLSTAIQSPFGGPDPAFAVVRAAVAIAAASRSICLGGGLVSSGAHSGRFLGMSKLEIGSSGGGNFLNGHIRRVAFWPRRMSNLDLQGLTR